MKLEQLENQFTSESSDEDECSHDDTSTNLPDNLNQELKDLIHQSKRNRELWDMYIQQTSPPSKTSLADEKT